MQGNVAGVKHEQGGVITSKNKIKALQYNCIRMTISK